MLFTGQYCTHMCLNGIVLYEGDAPASAEKAIEVGTGEEIYGDLYDDEGEKDVLLKAKHAAVTLHPQYWHHWELK